MSRTCIVTDSTALFSNQSFKGSEHVYVIPHRLQFGDQLIPDNRELKINKIYDKSNNNTSLQIHPPSVESFRQLFISLGYKYHAIVVILLSSNLSFAVDHAHEAAYSLRSSADIHVIDSETTAVGLGLLVQNAAEAAAETEVNIDINRLVRGNIRNIYTAFCLPDLIYLHRSGQLDLAQALVGEMLEILPFFILEYGKLVPVQKARSSRHLVDILHEFITEFDHLQQLAIIQGIPSFEQETRNLRERINQNFPTIKLSEHIMGAALGTILGPRSLGLVVIENRKYDS
jgi:DegV family protein with EDD domain